MGLGPGLVRWHLVLNAKVTSTCRSKVSSANPECAFMFLSSVTSAGHIVTVTAGVACSHSIDPQSPSISLLVNLIFLAPWCLVVTPRLGWDVVGRLTRCPRYLFLGSDKSHLCAPAVPAAPVASRKNWRRKRQQNRRAPSPSRPAGTYVLPFPSARTVASSKFCLSGTSCSGILPGGEHGRACVCQ